MSILITGGAGFIGSNLADSLLSDGEEIIVLDNFNNYYDSKLKRLNITHNLKNPLYRLYEGDIRDQQLIDKVFLENNIEAVVHLAAQAGVRKSFENPKEYISTNIEGSCCVLEGMRKSDVKKIIFASSSSVYGNCRSEQFSEDLQSLCPLSPYAMTKLSGEHLMRIYSQAYGINAICLRFFTVYGSRQRPDLAIQKFSKLILQGEPIEVYGDGKSLRDYTHVKDTVTGIKLALKYDKTSYEIINIGSGNPVSLHDMISTLERALNKKSIIKYSQMPAGDVLRTYADITKAKKLLGYQPQISFNYKTILT